MYRIIYISLLLLATLSLAGQIPLEESNLVSIDGRDLNNKDLIKLLKDNGYHVDKKLSSTNHLVTKERKLAGDSQGNSYRIDLLIVGGTIELRGSILDHMLTDKWLRASSSSPESSSRHRAWQQLQKLANSIGASTGGKISFGREPEPRQEGFPELYLG